MGQKEIGGEYGESDTLVEVVGTDDCPGESPGHEGNPDGQTAIVQSCRRCCFARGSSCELGRAEKFEALHPGCTEVAPEGHLLIHGRYCKAARPLQWAEANAGEDLAKLVRREMSIRVGVVVPLTQKSCSGRGAWTRLVNSLLGQTLRPFQVMFVNGQNTLSPQEVHKKLWEAIGSEFTWRIVQPAEETGDIGWLIDMGAARMADEVTHFAVFCPGRSIPADHLARIDSAVNDDLEKLACLIPPKRCYPSGLVVQRNLWEHPWVQGFSEVELDGKGITDIAQKLARFARKSGDEATSYRKGMTP